MIIHSALYLVSSPEVSACPKPDLPEYAFIGRSNVGKSSLINMITNNKGLAKTSSTPGKTQLINHFIINNEWYLADLPGYGFAKTAKTNRDKWEKMIKDYLLKRPNLLSTFVLIDSRIEPQQMDIDFIEWLGLQNLPFVLVFTKKDKLSRGELTHNLDVYKKHLLQNWETLPPIFTVSAKQAEGKTELLHFIEDTNKLFRI